jgi:hypothetical protein
MNGGIEWGLYYTKEDFANPRTAAAEKARGKSQVQLMYEFFTGGLRPQRPAAQVVPFPDPSGNNQARLEAWAEAIEMVERNRQRSGT